MSNPLNIFFFVSGAHSLWEFPILTLKYGGVVFIMVYLFMFLLLGAPMLLLEMTLGQYSALTPTKLFRNLCPVSIDKERNAVAVANVTMFNVA